MERGSGILQLAQDKAKSRNVGMHNRERMKEHLFSVFKRNPKGTELKL